MKKRDFIKVLGTAAIAAPIAASINSIGSPSSSQAPKTDNEFNTAFKRIEKTGVMVCGYIDYKMYSYKDPLTGKMAGIFYDLTENIARNAGYKTRWVETTYATLTEDLRLEKFDVFCGGLWPSINEAKVLRYSIAAFYAGLGIYVRKDDTRFPNNFDVPSIALHGNGSGVALVIYAFL